MKNIVNMFPLTACLLCMALFAACGNEDSDYRDAWVGTYVGECRYQHSAGWGDYQFDTVCVNETLSVAKQGDNGLLISYIGQSLSNLSFSVDCNPDGTFSSTTNNPHSEWNGSIKGDSLFFNYYDVSQGQSSTRHFKGSKRD
jgi:hypothetical protein